MVSEYRLKQLTMDTATMAPHQSAQLNLLGKLKLTDVPDRIRIATDTLYQELIDAEATTFIGAASFERSDTRTTLRNGTRPEPSALPPTERRTLATGSFIHCRRASSLASLHSASLLSQGASLIPNAWPPSATGNGVNPVRS
ncbi:MAG: transposase, Mutator family protein [Glaciihabitans sp.]|nr:transposase, Mutator family protein [Glaciihabitans sp.]